MQSQSSVDAVVEERVYEAERWIDVIPMQVLDSFHALLLFFLVRPSLPRQTR